MDSEKSQLFLFLAKKIIFDSIYGVTADTIKHKNFLTMNKIQKLS